MSASFGLRLQRCTAAILQRAAGRPSRRPWILGICLVGAVVAGCKRSQPDDQPAPAAAVRTDVPLRVVLMGEDSTAAAIEQAWSGISEQPLDVTVVPVGAAAAQLVQQAGASDVLIYPSQRTAILADADLLSPLPDAVLGADALDAAGLLPALRSGPMQYGGQTLAVPLGAVQPALLVGGAEWDDEQRPTWQQYQQRIAELPAGRAAEPLAEGWAAMMFLWRANTYSASAWLFDRDDFRPLLTEPPYDKALSELVQAATHYPSERMTPQQVWQAVLADRLDVAIGWPAGVAPDAAAGDLRVLPPPAADEVYTSSLTGWRPVENGAEAVLLAGTEPVASIAASCRQTAAARRFLQWIAGAEGAAMLRQQVPAFTVTRQRDPDAQAGRPSGDAVADRYSRLLRGQLSGNRMRPILRLKGAHEYLQALDQQVIAAIEGRQDVPTSLRQATAAWEAITDRHGRSDQQRAWRRSQGLRY